ncbi:MAG: hypothetical protein ABFE13_11970 [Phycisphaerales bacterium]
MRCSGIVATWLRDNGYDGLAGEECGCGVEDLMPCCDTYAECEPAYHWQREGCARADTCEYAGECGVDGCWRTKRQMDVPAPTDQEEAL